MTRRLSVTLLAPALACAFGLGPRGAADEPKLTGDLAKLQGTWKGKGGPPGQEATMTLTVRRKSATITFVTPASDENTADATLLIDETTNPKDLDFADFRSRFGSGGSPPPPFIYDVQGDTLKICGGRDRNSPRPKEFKTGGAGAGYTAVFTLQRQKK